VTVPFEIESECLAHNLVSWDARHSLQRLAQHHYPVYRATHGQAVTSGPCSSGPLCSSPVVAFPATQRRGFCSAQACVLLHTQGLLYSSGMRQLALVAYRAAAEVAAVPAVVSLACCLFKLCGTSLQAVL
jgi:hypothetical protein